MAAETKQAQQQAAKKVKWIKVKEGGVRFEGPLGTRATVLSGDVLNMELHPAGVFIDYAVVNKLKRKLVPAANLADVEMEADE